MLLVGPDDGSGTFDGISITTKTHLAPAEHQVAIDLHPLTGLTRPCVAVCTWPVEVEIDRIRRVTGRVTKANLEQVLERIVELRAQGVINSRPQDS